MGANIRIIFLTGMLVCKALCLPAQDYLDLASFSYTTALNRSFEDLPNDKAIQEWNLTLDAPIVLSPKTALITGITAGSIRVGLYPSSAPITNLYTLSLRLGWNTVYSEKWSGTYLIVPKISSDFTSGFRNGKQIGFIGLLTNTKSARLKYMYGLYTNTEEFGFLIVPLAGIYFKSSNDLWTANLLLPARADINYRFNDNTSTGISFDGLGSSFSIQNTGFSDHYVTRSSLEFYGYGEFKVSPNLFLRAKFGYSYARNYRVYSQDDQVRLSLVGIFFGNKAASLNTDLEDGFQAKAQLIYRFDLSNRKN
ncbi:MAG: hypothetical protein HKP53_04560 [Eudoraea sp.]|nr:hypothetical protein [Eudoraea sp.]